jgi:hypothetical protein
MPNSPESTSFRLSAGGLCYRLALQAGLCREDVFGSRRLVFVLIALTWLPLVILSALGGTLNGGETGLNLLADLKPHVRCLVAVPLLVLAGNLIDPVISAVIDGFRQTGILADQKQPAFDKAVGDLARRRDAWLPDVIMLLVIAALTWAFASGVADVGVESDTNSWMQSEADDAPFTLAGWWYLIVSSPILQILLYRWLWRFGIWANFLYRVSRIPLNLEPTHPDLAGGLGALKFAQGAFTIVFIAFGAMISVSLAQEIIRTDISLTEVTPLIAGFVVACIILSLAPLLFFIVPLIDAKRRGRAAYGALGQKLTRAFDERWTRSDKAGLGEEMLQAVDPSAMADYSGLYENVRNMHVVPVSLRELSVQAVLLAAPFLPLILIDVPLADLIGRLVNSLV